MSTDLELMEPQELEQAVEIVEQRNNNLPTAPIMTLMATEQLSLGLERLAANRTVIEQFVKSQLKQGVDFGTAFAGAGKPTLLKPGQEKIFALFGISSTCEKDDVTLSMFDGQAGLVCYLCRMYKDSQLLGEGRGAAKLGDKNRDANATIKIAQKRARMDAALTLGFSDFFTQDMEDPDYQPTPRAAADRAKPYAASHQDIYNPEPEITALPKDLDQTERDVTIDVFNVEKLTSKASGNPYAKITTSTGKVIMAWKNTHDKFVVGKRYKVLLKTELDNRGNTTLSVLRIHQNPEDAPPANYDAYGTPNNTN